VAAEVILYQNTEYERYKSAHTLELDTHYYGMRRIFSNIFIGGR
jgi:hypothetical protein